MIPVLIKYRAVHGFLAFQEVAGPSLVCMFPATTEYRVNATSIVLGKEILEVLPGSIVFG
jgi:hypothetical protein